MEENRDERVYTLSFSGIHEKKEDEELNKILNEGYEIKEIIPCYDSGSHLLNDSAFGITVTYLMIKLIPSKKRTRMTYLALTEHKNICSKIDEIIINENKNGEQFFELIPINTFTDSNKGCNTAYLLVFIRDRQKELIS